VASAPPSVTSAPASAAPGQSAPASNANHPANLDIPAVPSSVNPGYLQDIPTLFSNKKPAV